MIESPDNDYGYDDLNCLVTVDYIDETDEGFNYDKLGSRTGEQDLREGTEDYSVDSQTNRYNSVGLDVYYYDDAGNLTVGADGYKYTYDYENRILKIEDNADDLVTDFVYDALGRRIQKYDAQADRTTRYYHNHNWQVLTEWVSLWRRGIRDRHYRGEADGGEFQMGIRGIYKGLNCQRRMAKRASFYLSFIC